MTLSELQAWVLRTVQRPEKAPQVLDAINAVIEIACAHGDYAWDLIEGSLTTPVISSSEYAQTISISSNFTRFRKMKYLRPTNYTKYITWRDSARIFDKGRETVDVYYRAGDNIVFKVCSLITTLKYGYYSYPARLTTGSNNYTAQMASALHDLAAGRIYEDIGNDSEAVRLNKRGMAALEIHKTDKQDGVSYS